MHKRGTMMSVKVCLKWIFDTPRVQQRPERTLTRRESYSSQEGRMLFKRRDEESKKGWIYGWFYEKREGT